MIHEIVVPILDQTTTEVTLVRWLKREGDDVQQGEALCEIETDKATAEIEASADGVLRRILIAENTPIPPLTVVALVSASDEALPDFDPFYRTDRAAPGERAAPKRVSAGGPDEIPTQPIQKQARPILARATRGEMPISPRAARLAQEKGIDVTHVTGSGPGGRILEEDVLRVIEQALVSSAGMSRAAQAKAERVSQSWQTIPHFYTTITIDMSHVMELKQRAPVLTTYTDYIALSIALSLRQNPILNGHWLNDAPVMLPEIFLGLVVQAERGLVIPVLSDMHRRSLADITTARVRLVKTAREGKLPAAALSGATFTLSNLGPGNIDSFTAIINPPELAILSVGSIKPRPHVVGDKLEIRPMAIFTLGVDHRAIDGAQCATFLETLKDCLETLQA